MKPVTVMLVAVFVCIPYVLHGQNENNRVRQRRERVEELRTIKLIEALQLDEETSVRFLKRYNQNQDEMKVMLKERGDKIDQLEAAVKKQQDAECGKILDEILSIDKQITEKRIDFVRGLSSLLTKEQQARFVIFERNFLRDLREMVQQQSGRR